MSTRYLSGGGDRLVLVSFSAEWKAKADTVPQIIQTSTFMMSSLLHRVRKFTLRLFQRVILCKDGGGSEVKGVTVDVADVRSVEEDQSGVIGRLLGKNVSMEFILEMREAFQMFDKGPFIYDSHTEI